MTTGLPISRIAAVSLVLSQPPAQAQNFNSCLILGTSTVIDVVSRIREFSSSSDVAASFGSDADETKASQRWFGQSPQPTSIQIGRWAQTDSSGQAIGGVVSAANQLITAWQAVGNGAMEVSIDGVPYSITGLDFSTVANLNAVAGIIQTALQGAGAAGATVTWNLPTSNFIITSGTTGVASTVSLVSGPHASGNITFAANPANNDTVTIGGTAVTFKAAGPVVGNQVLIGASLSATLVALTNFLNNSQDVNISKADYTSTPTKLYVVYATPGAGGNAFTIAASVAVPSGATLAGGAGTDISAMLSLAAAPAYVANGIAAETALTAVQLLDDQFSNSWYGLVIPAASDADHLVVGAFIDTTVTPHFYGLTSSDPGILSSTSQTDIAFLLKEQGSNCMVQYSSTDPFAVVSALARILTTDWSGSNTAITLKFKTEPGVVAENLSISQANILEGKNCNVFVEYTNGVAILEQGICSSGQYVDAIIGSDWFATFMQTSIFNILQQSSTKIPQTDAGNHVLATVIQSVCAQALANGLVGPGTWNQPGFGQLNEGDFLENGFYVFQPPISSQSTADRAARKSVAFQVAAIYAGAIHSASVAINVSQ